MALQLGRISISNRADGRAVIDIEGIIGIPEWWQFEHPDERVSTYDTFKKRIDEIRNLSVPTVEVNIRSLGGNVNDALLIHDTLCALSAAGIEVITACYGFVASAATIVAQAADSGRRHISRNALYLIHRAMNTVQGNREDLLKSVETLDKADALIAGIYARRSGHPAEEFAALMDADGGHGRWLNAEETLAAGLADTVIAAAEIVNHAEDMTFWGYALPSLPPIIHQNDHTMKIKKTWHAILNYFGFDGEADNSLTEAQVEKLNNELESRGAEIGELKKQLETKDADLADLRSQAEGIAAKDERIADLTAQVNRLEAENEKLKAGPTTTAPQEDPDVPVPGAGKTVPANRAAYDADAKAFKE